MIPIKEDPDYRARWQIVERHFCSRPNFKNAVPLQIRDLDGLRELSFVFFVGWLFCGILNRDKELVRPCLLPMGKDGDSSLLVLYHPNTPLAAPARRELELFDADFFACPLDKAARSLSATERRLCPVVNKLRYNLAHAKPNWDVTGLREPRKTEDCCASKKAFLWNYLADTVCADPDLYGPMVGGAAFPVRLPFAILSQYLTGVLPRTRDFGNLLEETLLWFAMARSEIMIGAPHVTFSKPFQCNEIDLLLYECAGKTKALREDPAGGWEQYLADQAICVIELTIGHHVEGKEATAAEAAVQDVVISGGKDAPKNKLVNYLALKSAGFRQVKAHYVSIVSEPNLAPALQKALKCTDGFRYVFLPELVGDDVESIVLNHHDVRVAGQVVRKWHEALIKVVEEAGAEFAAGLK
jgi:hypothetical protein